MKKLIQFISILSLSLIAAGSCLGQSTIAYQQLPIVTYTAASQAPTIVTILGSGAQYHQITWNVIGTLSACQIEVDSSPTGIGSWTNNVITPQTCTTGVNGSALSTAIVANYVRINPNSTIVGSGSLVVNLTGFMNNNSTFTNLTVTTLNMTNCQVSSVSCSSSNLLSNNANIVQYNVAGTFSNSFLQTFGTNGFGITNGTGGVTTYTPAAINFTGTMNFPASTVTGDTLISANTGTNFIGGTPSAPSVGSGNGNSGIYFSGATTLISASAANVATFGSTGIKALGYSTNTKCAATGSAANPSVAACAAAPAGLFSCATASAGNCQINTTSGTNSSTIIVQQRLDTTAGTALGVTCNTTPSIITPLVTAYTSGTSFSLIITTPAVNPDCFDYFIVN